LAIDHFLDLKHHGTSTPKMGIHLGLLGLTSLSFFTILQIVWILKQPHNLLLFLCFNIGQKLKTRIVTKIKSDKQATKKKKIVSNF
jgi:hypothetical protein